MGKITTRAALEAAREITKPLLTKYEQSYTELKEFLIGAHLKRLPKEIVEVWTLHSEYVEKTTGCYVYGIGISNDDNWYNLSKALPSAHGSSIKLELDKKESTAYVKLKDAADNMYNKWESTKTEIYNTLLTLGTHKKVGEVMPNALRFFPEASKVTQTLVVQIQPVVDKVNCLISNEQKCVENL
jgi:hypothetical protein